MQTTLITKRGNYLLFWMSNKFTMILEIQARILGKFDIEKDMIVSYNPYEVNVFVSEDNINYFISIKKKVINYERFITKYSKNVDGSHDFILTPPECYEDVISLLQHIESFGGIDKNITKIEWENPLITWIPEIDEEKGIMPLLSHKKNQEFVITRRVLSKNWLQQVVSMKNQVDDVHIPFGFIREGTIHYHAQKYQLAFTFYFLMLEFCFADGKFDTHSVTKNFLKSEILQYAINESLSQIMIENGVHLTWLQKTINTWNISKKDDKKISYDVTGVIQLIIDARGKAMHATKKSILNRIIFNEGNFHSLAFLMMQICLFASIKLRLLPFIGKKI